MTPGSRVAEAGASNGTRTLGRIRISEPISTISRRSLLSAPLMLAACAKGGEYFGLTQPPTDQQLTYLIGENRRLWTLPRRQAVSRNSSCPRCSRA